MFLLDDIFLAPFKGLVWVFEEIRDAAEQELANDADLITIQLQQLYTLLESGQITEAEFDTRESELLDRLDAIQERGTLDDD
jgi:hypothetical protein